MSRPTSPSTHRPYGIARVLRVWELPRSTFYAQRERRAQPATGRRGRSPTLDDAALFGQIQAFIEESPFYGEGHRKIWARLRILKGVRTSMRRVLRVMREAELLAPTRHPEPVAEHPHEGTIVTDRPNVMWGTDATAAVTILEGPATIFAAIDHCTAECVGIHAAVAVISAPNSLVKLIASRSTTNCSALKRRNSAALCSASTYPMQKDMTAAMGSASAPMASICCTVARHRRRMPMTGATRGSLSVTSHDCSASVPTSSAPRIAERPIRSTGVTQTAPRIPWRENCGPTPWLPPRLSSHRRDRSR